MISPGFRQSSTSPLLVPADISRMREVWTRDEWKTLERVTKLLNTRGIELFMGCDQPGCQKTPLERFRQADGSIVLRCDHKDRVLQR